MTDEDLFSGIKQSSCVRIKSVAHNLYLGHQKQKVKCIKSLNEFYENKSA
jgi:hypothetical protein